MVVIYFTDIYEQKSFPMLDLEEMDTYSLRDVVVMCHNSDQRNVACCVLYDRLLDEHQGYHSKALNKAKVNI